MCVSSPFGIGPYTFFYLVLVLAVCKRIGFGPFVSSMLKKKTQN